MARVNVYLPDDLAREAHEAKLNISGVAQAAIRAELGRHRTREWLDSLEVLPSVNVSHQEVMRALDEGRDRLWGPDL